MDKSLLTKCIFSGADSLLVIVLLAKIIYSFVFYKRKHKASLNRSFWFYLFFAITYGCVAIVQWVHVFIDAHPLEYLNIDRAFLGFSRNLFFIGSFLSVGLMPLFLAGRVLGAVLRFPIQVKHKRTFLPVLEVRSSCAFAADRLQ